MGLKNEAQSALRDTRYFYREYMSGVSRKTISRDLRDDTTRLKDLYNGVIDQDDSTGEMSGLQRFSTFLLTVTKRLNPTRRLVLGLCSVAFLIYYPLSLFGWAGFPLLLPFAFIGLIAILMLELLEKTDVIKEFDLARDIQLSLLPAIETRHNHLEFYAFANTAREVGGDYVDLIKTAEGTYLVIADVSGKGLGAALYMVRIQALVHLIIKKYSPSPKELFLELNAFIKSGKSDKTFVTACAAFFPKNQDSFIFARAGHNPPILYSRDTDKIHTLETGGLALGMAPNPILETGLQEQSFPFKPGDSLLAYTDGLTEARNESGDEYGEEELKNLISIYGSLRAKSISFRVQSSLEEFIGSQKPMDDITFAVLRNTGDDKSPTGKNR